MPFVLALIRDEIEVLTGETFNSVLCNLYRNGKDSVGWHADDEPIFGGDPVVASVSFGADRVFQIRGSTSPTGAPSEPDRPAPPGNSG